MRADRKIKSTRVARCTKSSIIIDVKDLRKMAAHPEARQFRVAVNKNQSLFYNISIDSISGRMFATLSSSPINNFILMIYKDGRFRAPKTHNVDPGNYFASNILIRGPIIQFSLTRKP